MKRIKGIIVEGVDCSGKSTLLTHLASELSRHGWDTLDLRHRKMNQFERYCSAYVNADKVLFDRGHFSEFVYGNIWRDGKHFSDSDFDWLNNYVNENYIVIFAFANEETLRARYAERSISQEIEQDELIAVQDKFYDLFKNRVNGVIFYESSGWDSLREVVSSVYEKIGISENTTNLLKQKDEQHVHTSRSILLEGVNGSGKSTLGKLLKVNMVGWGIKTLDYKPIAPFARYLKEYVNNPYTIFDRGHISEIAYGNIFREGVHFTSAERSLISSYMKNRIDVIFCDPPAEVIQERLAKQNYPKHVHHTRISQIRDEMLKAMNADKIAFHCVDTSSDESISEIISKITGSFNTTPYSQMGWDRPLGD